MVPRIRKAVFPVAGLGTRFLPATKAIPKEMLPIVDRPLIQLVVDEARDAGIEQFIFVTGRNKEVIEDHFDTQFELEATLKLRNQSSQLASLEKDELPAGTMHFTRQKKPLGLGHAIWCARHLVGDEPFAVLLPDMIFKTEKSCLGQLFEAYQQAGGGNLVAVEEVPWSQVSNYGVIAPGEWHDRRCSIERMVEKPRSGTAPSNLIISGRYILQPEIFGILDRMEGKQGREIQITDAMVRLLKDQPFHALKYVGDSFDCGSKLGFLAANIAFALDREELAGDLRSTLSSLISEAGGSVSWPKDIRELAIA
jgi:UTP--glucose-1-phosphate uridylyltransferase